MDIVTDGGNTVDKVTDGGNTVHIVTDWGNIVDTVTDGGNTVHIVKDWGNTVDIATDSRERLNSLHFHQVSHSSPPQEKNRKKASGGTKTTLPHPTPQNTHALTATA